MQSNKVKNITIDATCDIREWFLTVILSRIIEYYSSSEEFVEFLKNIIMRDYVNTSASYEDFADDIVRERSEKPHYMFMPIMLFMKNVLYTDNAFKLYIPLEKVLGYLDMTCHLRYKLSINYSEHPLFKQFFVYNSTENTDNKSVVSSSFVLKTFLGSCDIPIFSVANYIDIYNSIYYKREAGETDLHTENCLLPFLDARYNIRCLPSYVEVDSSDRNIANSLNSLTCVYITVGKSKYVLGWYDMHKTGLVYWFRDNLVNFVNSATDEQVMSFFANFLIFWWKDKTSFVNSEIMKEFTHTKVFNRLHEIYGNMVVATALCQTAKVSKPVTYSYEDVKFMRESIVSRIIKFVGEISSDCASIKMTGDNMYTMFRSMFRTYFAKFYSDDRDEKKRMRDSIMREVSNIIGQGWAIFTEDMYTDLIKNNPYNTLSSPMRSAVEKYFIILVKPFYPTYFKISGDVYTVDVENVLYYNDNNSEIKYTAVKEFVRRWSGYSIFGILCSIDGCNVRVITNIHPNVNGSCGDMCTGGVHFRLIAPYDGKGEVEKTSAGSRSYVGNDCMDKIIDMLKCPNYDSAYNHREDMKKLFNNEKCIQECVDLGLFRKKNTNVIESALKGHVSTGEGPVQLE